MQMTSGGTLKSATREFVLRNGLLFSVYLPLGTSLAMLPIGLMNSLFGREVGLTPVQNCLLMMIQVAGAAGAVAYARLSDSARWPSLSYLLITVAWLFSRVLMIVERVFGGGGYSSTYDTIFLINAPLTLFAPISSVVLGLITVRTGNLSEK